MRQKQEYDAPEAWGQAHQALVIELGGEEEQAVPLIQWSTVALWRSNAERHRPIDKHALRLFTVLEAVDDIALPGPADELWTSPLRDHGLCRAGDQTVHHLLQQE